jgi:heme-degrading monooxygenase HmoA
MIIRIWMAQATSEGAARYQEHFASHVLPTLSRLDGYLGASLLGRNHGQEVELVVISRWRDIQAIRAFTGHDLERAVVAEEASAVLTRWDPRVRHYEERLGSEQPSPPASAPAGH